MCVCGRNLSISLVSFFSLSLSLSLSLPVCLSTSACFSACVYLVPTPSSEIFEPDPWPPRDLRNGLKAVTVVPAVGWFQRFDCRMSVQGVRAPSGLLGVLFLRGCIQTRASSPAMQKLRFMKRLFPNGSHANLRALGLCTAAQVKSMSPENR